MDRGENAEEIIKFLEDSIKGITEILNSEEARCLRSLGKWALHPSTFGHQLAVEGDRQIEEWLKVDKL